MKALTYQTALIYLLGKWIKHKHKNEALIVNHIDELGVIKPECQYLTMERLSYQEILDEYVFFDGSPIGIQE